MVAEISSQKFCMSIMKTSHLIHVQLVEIWPDQSASFKKQGSSYEQGAFPNGHVKYISLVCETLHPSSQEKWKRLNHLHEH